LSPERELFVSAFAKAALRQRKTTITNPFHMAAPI
jgi:hypothetical protein